MHSVCNWVGKFATMILNKHIFFLLNAHYDEWTESQAGFTMKVVKLSKRKKNEEFICAVWCCIFSCTVARYIGIQMPAWKRNDCLKIKKIMKKNSILAISEVGPSFFSHKGHINVQSPTYRLRSPENIWTRIPIQHVNEKMYCTRYNGTIHRIKKRGKITRPQG